jgi:hypothetical protein
MLIQVVWQNRVHEMVHKLVDSPTVLVPTQSVEHVLGQLVECFTRSCGILAAKVMETHDSLAPLVCMQRTSL